MPTNYATHLVLLDAVQEMLRDANMAGMADQHIQVGVLDVDDVRCLPGPPGILVTPQSIEELTLPETSNVADYPWYPVSCAICMEYCVGKASRTEIERMLKWRERTREVLSHATETFRAYLTNVQMCEIHWIPGRIFVRGAWTTQGLWVSLFALRIQCRHLR